MTLRSSNNNFGDTHRKKRESSSSFFNHRTSESCYVQESKSVVLDKFSALRNESIGQRLKKQDTDSYNQIKKKQDFIDQGLDNKFEKSSTKNSFLDNKNSKSDVKDKNTLNPFIQRCSSKDPNLKIQKEVPAVVGNYISNLNEISKNAKERISSHQNLNFNVNSNHKKAFTGYNDNLAPFDMPSKSQVNTRMHLGDYSKKVEIMKDCNKLVNNNMRNFSEKLAKQNEKFDAEISKISRTSMRKSPIKQKIYKETGFDSFVKERDIEVSLLLIKILEIDHN